MELSSVRTGPLSVPNSRLYSWSIWPSKTMAYITTQTAYIEKPSQCHVGKVARHIFNDKRATSSLRIELLDWNRGREAAFDKLQISNRAVFWGLSFIESDSPGHKTMHFGVRIGSQPADT